MSYSSQSQSIWKSSPSLPTNTGQDYWSIDDILSGQERLPCRVEQPFYRLGFLSSHSGEEHLMPGTKLDLPAWAIRALCTRKRRLLSVQLPRAYKETMRTAIMADATVIDLHRNGPYYYGLGLKILHFDLPETTQVAASLLDAFLKRFRQIMDYSQNAYQTDLTRFSNILDEMEKHLFALGQQTLNDKVRWERGQCKILGKSSILESSRKRKFQD